MTDAAVFSKPEDPPALDARPDAQRRPPPKAVQLLLPVWGHRYIRQFLEFGLPSLLAPGNLPALAKALPCKLVFLTSEEDAKVLRDHPACRYLASLCDVDVHAIDDLITGDNYSTTITLAYARAVRAAGAEMRDTCFFFLISDYVIADGSLASVLARMQAGASGVLAGNFQVVAEEAMKSLYKKFDRGTPELVLPSRQLMTWALPYLHPMTAANMVNFPLCHSIHSNRLFWRVDENTLIGRFYLMHMICIRPEVADFIVGSSCDYSFIPEMCPSGNVAVLTDSDDYLVVEMQPRHHERTFLRMGPVEERELAASLSEWTTERHRENARFTLVFHAADISSTFAQIAAEVEAFLGRVSQDMSTKPQPHRDHPYWIGAIAAHRWALRQKAQRSDDELSEVVEARGTGWRSRIVNFIQDSRFWVFGRPPYVRPWHPRWPDYRVLAGILHKSIAGRHRNILVLSTSPAVFANWVGDIADKTTSWHIRRVLDLKRPQYMALRGSFDGCLMFLGLEDLDYGRILTERIRPLLRDDGFLLIDAANGRATSVDDFFNTAVAYHADRFLNLSTWVTSIDFVAATPLRLAVLRRLHTLSDLTVRRPLRYLPLTVIAAMLLAIIGLVCNIAALRAGSQSSRHKLYSSVCMVLRPSRSRPPLPDFTPDESLYWRPGRFKATPEPTTELAPQPESA